jgi:hypothetical protein
MGVGHGDRVATLLGNRAEQVVSFFAALKLGAVQVPINTAYKGEFLRHQLADSGARVFIVQGDFASRAAEVVSGATTPDLSHLVVVDPPDAVIDAVPAVSWGDALDSGSDLAFDAAKVRPGDLACFIYTAGTTGPVQGLHVVAQLRREPRRADRARVGPKAGRHRADSVAAVPLQRDHGVRRRFVADGGERRDRAPVLGEQLLAGGAAHRRNDGEHARLARDPDRERRRPSGAARAPAASVRGRADAARHRPCVAGPIRLQDLQRRVRPHGGHRWSRCSMRASRTSRARPASRTATSSR